MTKKSLHSLTLFFIVLLGLGLRLYGIDWDSGFHLHPDERMLIMVADKIHFFSQLNPHFFNYGSLPIYILKSISQIIDTLFHSQYANYDNMLYIGRILSTLIDTAVIILIYKISYLVATHLKLDYKNARKVSIFSSLFYAITFFAIQNSNFFVVDVFLNFFSTLLVYEIIKVLINKKISYSKLVLIGIISAAILTTKVSGVVFVGMAGLTIMIISLVQYKEHRVLNFIINTFVYGFSAISFSFIFMPYAFLNHQKFISDILAQLKMNSNPYIFPYTLQYVGTTPYLYYLKNIFIWGIGPAISLLSITGLFYLIYDLRLKIKEVKHSGIIVFLLSYYLLYFLLIGKSAVKFMRYMLPLYPFLIILAGYGIWRIQSTKLKTKFIDIQTSILFALISIAFLWTLSFLHIYTTSNTRVQATVWINQNVPEGKTLAVEHWDDRLPIFYNKDYKFEELQLYNLPDNEEKWSIVSNQLLNTDYIIIASNRLYVPLQRLSDCKKYKVCYPKTAHYYQTLFNEGAVKTKYGIIHFKKVAEFTDYPTLKFGGVKWVIKDDKADESFTVYDHPKIMIFKKTVF